MDKNAATASLCNVLLFWFVLWSYVIARFYSQVTSTEGSCCLIIELSGQFITNIAADAQIHIMLSCK